jgi:Ca2+-dependent lipid-binding protein
MLKLDIAGESDPFCIITIGNKSIKTSTFKNSSNPNWNEGLKIQTFLYGTIDEIKNNLPEINVEIYDEDPFNVIKIFGI